MVSSADFQKQIQNVENIKENLSLLVGVTQKKLGTFCRKHANEWMVKGTPTTKQSSWLDYFSISEKKVSLITEKFDVSNYIQILFSNQLFVSTLLFLTLFVIVYVASFIIYSSCGRRCISFFSCGLFFKRKGEKNGAKLEGANTNDKENSEYENSDIENKLSHDINEANENETQQNTDAKTEQNKKRELKLLTALISGLLLLIILFCLSMHATASVKKSQNGLYRTICQIMSTSEHILTGDCSNTNNGNQNNNQCFTVKEALNDGVHILEAFVEGVQVMESQNFLSKDKTMPLIEEIDQNTLKLKALLENINNNGNMLAHNYKHYLILGQHLKTVIGMVIETIENKKDMAENIVMESKEKMIQIGDEMEKILNGDVQHIVDKVNSLLSNLKKNIDKAGENSFVENKIGSVFDTFVTGFNIALLPIYIAFIITCIFIFYLLKKNEQSYNKIIVKLAGIFSVYFGLITILILIFVLVLTIVSMFGSTSCRVKKSASGTNKEDLFTIFSKNVPVVGVCFKDENATFVDEQIITRIENTMSNFDYTTITDDIDRFTQTQMSTLENFENSYREVANQLWLVQVDHSEMNALYNEITNEPIKKALLITHIYKKDVTEGVVLKGVDTFLSVANPILFQNGAAELCYEDLSCENKENKYNITKNSTINDSAYLKVRNISNVVPKKDIDNVLQLLAMKAKILHEKPFDVSNLDAQKTEKINIKEYITPDFETKENLSFINQYVIRLIKDFKSQKAANLFKQLINRFVEIKDYAIGKIQSYQRRLNCHVVMTEVKKVKSALCDNLIESIAYVTVIYFIVAVFTFILWLYFLCLWIYHKKQQ